MPRQEDVTELDLGSTHVFIVELKPENHEYMIDLAMSMYLGKRCKYCLKEYTTLEELKDIVYAGTNEFACEDCWKLNNE